MYDKKITRSEPALIIILIDQSISTNTSMVGNGQEKYDISHVAKMVTDNFLYEALRRCMKGSEYREYLDLAVIAYGSGQEGIRSALPKIPLSDFPFSAVKLQDTWIAKNDSTSQNSIFDKPKFEWIEARSDGDTPMLSAIRKSRKIIEKWLPQHPTSFPPLIINISDGGPTDDSTILQMYMDQRLGDLSETELISETKQIASMGTDNGKCIIANCHISPAKVKEILYPRTVDEAERVDQLAPILFEMSSIIPDELIGIGKSLDLDLEHDARFFIFNGGVDSLIKFMKFGTTAAGVTDNTGK